MMYNVLSCPAEHFLIFPSLLSSNSDVLRANTYRTVTMLEALDHTLYMF